MYLPIMAPYFFFRIMRQEATQVIILTRKPLIFYYIAEPEIRNS